MSLIYYVMYANILERFLDSPPHIARCATLQYSHTSKTDIVVIYHTS